MRFNVVRQPLLWAFFWLSLIVAAAVAWGEPMPGAAPAPLGDLLLAFQHAAPIWSKTIAIVLLLISGMMVGRSGVRFSLYPVGSNLPIPLYGLVACGILIGQNRLAEVTAAFVLLLSTLSFFKSYRNGFAIGLVFRGALFLGMLPLIYAPALPLPLMLIPAALFFRRTSREVFVAVFGALFPLFVLCYITWAMGGDFLDPPVQLWDNMMGDSGFRILENTTLLSPIVSGLVLLTVLCGIIFSLAHFRPLSRRAKSILIYTTLLFVVTCALAPLPSATAGLTVIIALPAALLMPHAFIRMHPLAANLFYVLLYGCCAANILLT